MNFLQLKYFKAVAIVENMTLAAKKLHVSQPSLSKSIKLLEEEIGYDLFDRVGKYIQLNKNGEIFLNYVNKCLNSLEDGILAIEDYNKKELSSVKISIMAAGKLLPYIIKEFSIKYPKIKLNLVNIDKNNFENSDCDLFLYTTLDDFHDNKSINLYKENLVLAVNKNHRFSKRNTIDFKELKDEPYISTEKNSEYNNILEHYSKIAGISLNTTIEAQYSSTIKGLVEAGIGVSIIPELTWPESYDNNLSFVNIENPNCIRYIKLMWKEDRYINSAVNVFKEYIINFFKKRSEMNV